jgi:hypothetical protein
MFRRVLWVAAALFLVYLSYVGIRFAFLASSASTLSSFLTQLGDISHKQNVDELSKLVAKANDSLSQANSIVNDPLLAPSEFIPVFGGDFRAAKTLVNGLHDIAGEGEPIVSHFSKALAKPNGDKTSSSRLADFNTAAKMHGLITKIDSAQNSLENIDAQNLHFGLDKKIILARGKLSALSRGLTQLEPLVAALEPILANQNKQTWFIATQNLAEARGTGGILGSYAVVNINDGQPSLFGAGSDQDLDRIGRVKSKALPESLQRLWGGTPNDWRDMNVSSHVPYFGQQIYDSLMPKLKIDGVIVIGQGAVAQLTAATGSFDIDGVHVDSQNVSDFLAKGIYAKYGDVGQKNAWVSKFMHALFARLEKRDFDYGSIWRAATSNLSGDRVSAWAKSSQLQSRFLHDGVAGEVSSKPGSAVQVSLNNAGGNKLDAYLQLEAKYSLGQCGVETDLGLAGRRAKLDVLISNNAPKSGLPKYVTPRSDLFPGQKLVLGSNRTLLSVYAPTDSTIDFFTLDGEPVNASQGYDHNHPVWVFDLSTLPGRSYNLVANWVEPTVNSRGKNTQVIPQLIAPVALNPVKTLVSTPGFCKVD